MTGASSRRAIPHEVHALRCRALSHPTGGAPVLRLIAIRPGTYQGQQAADWEFIFQGLHVTDRVVEIAGRGYSLCFQTSEADFPAALPTAQTMFATFVPAPP